MGKKASETVYASRSSPCRFAGAPLCVAIGNVGFVGSNRSIPFRPVRRGGCLRHYLHGVGIEAFASALAMPSIVFLGTISHSLYLTHTIALLAVIHLMPSPDIALRTITMAALFAIPVAASLTHFVVERPSFVFGRFLTGRSAADPSRAKQAV